MGNVWGNFGYFFRQFLGYFFRGIFKVFLGYFGVFWGHFWYFLVLFCIFCIFMLFSSSYLWSLNVIFCLLLFVSFCTFCTFCTFDTCLYFIQPICWGCSFEEYLVLKAITYISLFINKSYFSRLTSKRLEVSVTNTQEIIILDLFCNLRSFFTCFQ